MQWTADKVLVGEHFQENMALCIDDQGRIGSVRPATAPCDFGALLPAAAWPLSSVPVAGVADELCFSAARATYEAAHQARALWRAGAFEEHSVALLREMARQGVALVGLVLPAALDGDDEAESWPGVEEACRAIARTGIRAALVFACDERAARGGQLDGLCHRFDQGVRRVLAQHEKRASWALSLIGETPWPAAALVALRLRLAHLPLLVPLDAVDGPCGRAWLAMWRERRCLDSTVSFVAARSPDASERAWLHESGCLWLDVRQRRSRYTWARRMAEVGTAFALRAGLLQAGRWADVVALPPSRDASSWLDTWPARSPDPALQALYVAGQRVELTAR